MYRTCDIEQDKTIVRKNIREDLAQIGNRLIIPNMEGVWTVKRTHGYSTLPD